MIIPILKNLVEIQTVNPPGENYKTMVLYLKDLFSQLGFQIQLISIPEDYINKNYIYFPLNKGYKRVILIAKNSSKPLLQFNFHYDVVPPGEGWVTDPFKLKVIDGKIYGRGTSDMKSAIVSLFSALSKINDYPIEIAFVPDEESGGIGSKYLIEEIKNRPSEVIFGEPSFPDIYIGHFGILRGIIKVFGKQVHASIAKEGINAFIEASKLAIKLEERLVKKEKCSINLGGYTINSSNNDGIVPGNFTFSYYRSISPSDNRDSNFDKKIIAETANELGISYQFEVKSFIPGFISNQSSELAKIAESCIISKMNIKPQKLVSNMRYDAIFYKGSTSINFGPGNPNQAHTPNEYVDLKNIEKTALVYECILRSKMKNL
ncbi:ArgE/DapE family deacylase [Acidianus sulfidivorans JP7]|uniref:Succinyl-diaminopimelate desuccinylase n=1 Tax=Acidianus sulfidivorans JP7 TaxID=619593 RepID=A0A2U9IQC6_9CREN|nr:M20 family metallopeptidase [Acidianus sulfidivorans]AWR98230.1 ArgE/DapE family deacylase [Acidianus sulfidivorans JP7]